MNDAATALPRDTPISELSGSANIFRDHFGHLSDEEWRDLLIRSMKEPVIDGVPFPRFPAAEVQEQMHGHSGEISLLEGQAFYSFVKSRPIVAPILATRATLLDFGAGWGRHARFFLRDFDLDRIFGFEPNRGYCVLARSLNPYVSFLSGDFTPDETLPANRFDLVVSFSVFSHLSERSASEWLEELARAMRPGGCFVFTTWGRRFIDQLIKEQSKLLRDADADVHWYYKDCLQGIGDIRRVQEKYDRGEFVWFTTFDSELYGNAIIHPNALQSVLRARGLPLELVSFDQATLGQDTFTLRRVDQSKRTPPKSATTEPVQSAPNPLTSLAPSLAQPAPPFGSESFCIHLWQHFRIEANAEASVCCAFEGGRVSQDGAPMSLERQSFAEIWNSDMMRGLRRDMVEGRHVSGCRQCYADEARGGVSQRIRDNKAWETGWLNPKRTTIDEIAALAPQIGYRAAKLPALIEIETGNLCNLKCRMCSGASSSLVAADPVQSKWSDSWLPSAPAPTPYSLRHPASVARLAKQLTQDARGEVKRLYFIGGEPLVVPSVRELLEGIVAAGHAAQMELFFVTNGLVLPSWLTLGEKFRRMDIAVSVDGYADHYEYIRYPGRWRDLTKRLKQLREISTAHVMVTSTIQAYNALNITDLFRYLDQLDLGFAAYLLHWPSYLAATSLPPAIRQVAAERLRQYGDEDCHLPHRALIASLAAQFEAGSATVDPVALRDFMLFTNDLDASRGQSIHKTDPELVDRLSQAGFPWLNERRHAGASGPRPRLETAELRT